MMPPGVGNQAGRERETTADHHAAGGGAAVAGRMDQVPLKVAVTIETVTVVVLTAVVLTAVVLTTVVAPVVTIQETMGEIVVVHKVERVTTVDGDDVRVAAETAGGGMTAVSHEVAGQPDADEVKDQIAGCLVAIAVRCSRRAK